MHALYEIAQADLAPRGISRSGDSSAVWRNSSRIFPSTALTRRWSQASPADDEFVSRARRGCENYLPSERSMAGRNPGPMAVWQANPSGYGCFASGRADAISATERASLRQGCGRHGLLPLWPADLAQRRRLRRATIFMLGRGIPQAHAERALHDFPHAMLATATHDHKRGEDVRARLAVLSELAGDWSQAVERWLELAASRCHSVDGTRMPDGGDLAILFQTIVGAWPLALRITDKHGLSRLRNPHRRLAIKGPAGSQIVQ